VWRLFDPSDAVIVRSPGVCGLAEVSRSARLGEDAEEPFEPARERHEEQAASLRHHSAVGMRYAARQKDQAAWPNLELLVAALVDVLAFDHVAHLVLMTMHVPRVSSNGAISSKTQNAPPVISADARTIIVVPPKTTRSPSPARPAKAPGCMVTPPTVRMRLATLIGAAPQPNTARMRTTRALCRQKPEPNRRRARNRTLLRPRTDGKEMAMLLAAQTSGRPRLALTPAGESSASILTELWAIAQYQGGLVNRGAPHTTMTRELSESRQTSGYSPTTTDPDDAATNVARAATEIFFIMGTALGDREAG
jgi:hypothetical protein